MYITEPNDRVLAATADAQIERDIALDRERREFIRETAAAYFAALPFDHTLEETPRKVLDSIWADARALWDARPEDC